MSSILNTVKSLPAHWYHDRRVFELEKTEIFDKEWLPLGPVQQLGKPGDWFVSELTGAALIVVRTEDDSVRVFHNICRHRGSTIVDQLCGNNRRFVCPYHGWVYALNGALVSAPGLDCSGAEFGLRSLATTIWNGVVWASISEQPPDWTDWLGDIAKIAERFVDFSAFDYETTSTNDIAINWKTYGDNSAEGYHLEYIHPALNASLKKGSNIDTYENGQFVGFDINYRGDDHPGTDGDNARPGFWIYKFPGILLHFSNSSFNIERVTPTSANSIRLSRWFWFAADVDQSTRQQTIQESNQVMSEDISICQRVQKNLDNGHMQHGLLSRDREPGTIYMQEIIRDRLTTAGINQ